MSGSDPISNLISQIFPKARIYVKGMRLHGPLGELEVFETPSRNDLVMTIDAQMRKHIFKAEYLDRKYKVMEPKLTPSNQPEIKVGSRWALCDGTGEVTIISIDRNSRFVKILDKQGRHGYYRIDFINKYFTQIEGPSDD